MAFFESVKNNSKRFEDPFEHWELNQPLTDEQIGEIINADIDDPTKHQLNYDGTRAIDGGEGKFREGISDGCLLYTSPSPRDKRQSRMPSSA